MTEVSIRSSAITALELLTIMLSFSMTFFKYLDLSLNPDVESPSPVNVNTTDLALLFSYFSKALILVLFRYFSSYSFAY